MAHQDWRVAGLLPGAGGLLAMVGVCLLVAGAPIFALPQDGVPKAEARAHRAVDRTIPSAEKEPLPWDAPLFEGVLPASQSPGSARGEEDRDVRWALMEMAGAGRGAWAPNCPCPVHSNDTPFSGPQ